MCILVKHMIEYIRHVRTVKRLDLLLLIIYFVSNWLSVWPCNFDKTNKCLNVKISYQGYIFIMFILKVYLRTSKVQVGGYLMRSNKYILLASFILFN
jgi:hypothetical protein